MLFIVASPAFAVTVDLGGYNNGVFDGTKYNAWNIYAFGDASVIVNILQSISAMVGSPEYHTALLFVAMLSFIGMAVVAAITGSMTGSGMKMLLMFIGFIFIIDVGFNDTVNLDVISALGFPNSSSSATGGPTQSYGSSMAVGNIPFIVGVPESIITTFGHELTNMIQQNFSIPNDLGVSQGGFNLANSLVNAETKLQITNPEFSETLSAFSQNCVMPSIAGGWLNPNLLAISTDLFPPTGGSSSYGGVNPALSTYVYDSDNPQGVLVNCGPAIGTTMSDTSVSSSSPGNAYEYIAWYLANKVSISDFNPADFGIQSFSSTGADNWLSTVENNANTFLLNQGSSSSSNNILQAAAINGMEPALRQAAALSGSSANMMGIAVAQGKQEMVSGWATAAAIFKEMSGYLYAVLQALVLAMGPLVIIAMFIPGTGLKLVGSYMQVAVWLALWQPLLSIVNYIVLLYSQAQSTAVLGGSSGFTMQNLPVVSEFTSRMILAGSFMATLVPLFAWGMVKGGMAVTDLITRGLSNQIMSQAGNVAATGNVTLGNESMNDNTIDQNMLMPKYSVGYGMATAGIDSASILTDSQFGGNAASFAGQRASLSETRAEQEAYSKDMSYSRSTVHTASKAMSKALASAEAFNALASSGGVGDQGYGQDNSTNYGANADHKIGNENSAVNEVGDTTTSTGSQENSAGVSGTVGGGLSGDIPTVTAKVDAKTGYQAKLMKANAALQQAKSAISASNKQGYGTESGAKVLDHAIYSFKALEQNSAGWSDAMREDYNKTMNSLEAAQSSYQKSVSYKTSATKAIQAVAPGSFTMGALDEARNDAGQVTRQGTAAFGISPSTDAKSLKGRVSAQIKSGSQLTDMANQVAGQVNTATRSVPGNLRSMSSLVGAADGANAKGRAEALHQSNKTAERYAAITDKKHQAIKTLDAAQAKIRAEELALNNANKLTPKPVLSNNDNINAWSLNPLDSF